MKKHLYALLISLGILFRASIAILKILLFLFFVFMAITLYLMSANPKVSLSKAAHCSLLNLKEVHHCNGFKTLGGWQNSGSYEKKATGLANTDICTNFKNADFSGSTMGNVENRNDFKRVFSVTGQTGSYCDEDAPEKYWSKTSCPWTSDNSDCYHCSRFLSNGNGYRYSVIGFSENCKMGEYIDIGEPSREDFLNKIPLLKD